MKLTLGPISEEQRDRLYKVAENVGAVGQRGPSISILNQMIADGELEVRMKPQVIEYDYDTETILGDYEAGNEEELLVAFEHHIDLVLSEAYPAADVKISEGGYGGNGLRVYDYHGNLSHELTEEVGAVVERAWTSFEWTNA